MPTLPAEDIAITLDQTRTSALSLSVMHPKVDLALRRGLRHRETRSDAATAPLTGGAAEPGQAA